MEGCCEEGGGGIRNGGVGGYTAIKELDTADMHTGKDETMPKLFGFSCIRNSPQKRAGLGEEHRYCLFLALLPPPPTPFTKDRTPESGAGDFLLSTLH